MTRKLPWLDSTLQAKSSPRKVGQGIKRRRVVEASSDIDDEDERNLQNGLTASTATSLEQLIARSMDEGLKKDDRYRMVEDEFLDVAKKFTQHLHAAEYQRLKKAARSQNADIINSISRPVSTRMPEETRRKVESVAKAKKQAAALNDGAGSDADSGDNGGIWLGTALHGLMESPTKSAMSLNKIGKVLIPARTNSHHNKSRDRECHSDSSAIQSNNESPKVISKSSEPQNQDLGESTSGEDDADDLDAPVRARPNRSSRGPAALRTVSNQHEVQLRTGPGFSKDNKSPVNAEAEESLDTMLSSISTASRERISKRLKHAKLRQEVEERKAHQELDIIPMFLP